MDYKAFVSSTYVDLKEHRTFVIGELRKAGFFVDPMEEWTSAAQEPKVVSTNRLDRCKLCILLIARRRGHVPVGDTLSITQQEVAEARRRGIDVLPFLLDDGVPESEWPWEDRAVVEAWRKEYFEHSCVSTFNRDPSSVVVGPALTRWVKEQGAEVALDLYLKLVEQEHGWIQFVGLPQLKDNPNVAINRLYVEPALAEQQVSPDTDPEEWPVTTPVLDEIANHQKIVVLGDPGSGKSTLVSWIAFQLARHHRHVEQCEWTERLGPLIPLPIILRNLDIGAGVTWDSLLRSFLDQPIGKLLEMADLQKILVEGRAIIMLDGLDEIGNPSVRRDLRKAIWAGYPLFSKCRWLLTSRIVGYDEVAFHVRRGIHKGGTAKWSSIRFVVPFDDARVDQFADNWFTVREESEFKRQQMEQELLAAVRAHESTTKLGRIPNLLTMMALIYRVRARLPHGRALLYGEITQAYLETIDYHRKIFARSESLAEKRRWLARVGFEMQRRRSAENTKENSPPQEKGNEILATGQQVRQWIAAAMAESGQEGSDADAAEFVDYLARRSGLLLPRGQDQFAFLHLSFQEYFAAVFLQDQIVSPDWLSDDNAGIAPGATPDEVTQHANESVWRETLVFLMEMMAAEQPRWLKALRNCLFGKDYSLIPTSLQQVRFLTVKVGENNYSTPENQNRVELLARVAIDPQAGFSKSEREQAIQVFCRWEMAASKAREGRTGAWIIARITRDAHRMSDIPERQVIIDHLRAAAQEFAVSDLDLSGMQISDLSPLMGLTALTTLGLRDTPVSDVSLLKGLTALTELHLDGTSVSDVSPLKGLTALSGLHLSGTSVSDVSPLKGLTALLGLHLSGTLVSDVSPLKGLAALTGLDLSVTSVSDVSPLKGLTALTWLDLSGTSVSDVSPLKGLSALMWLNLSVTSVSDVDVAELKKAIPGLTVYR